MTSSFSLGNFLYVKEPGVFVNDSQYNPPSDFAMLRNC